MLGSWITIRRSLADTSSRCFVLLWGPTFLWTFVDGQFAWNKLHLLLCRQCVKTALRSIHSFWHHLPASGAPPYGRCGLCLDCLVRVVRMGEFFSSVNIRTGKSLHQSLTRNVAWKNTTTALRVGFTQSVQKGGCVFFHGTRRVHTVHRAGVWWGSWFLMEMSWDGISCQHCRWIWAFVGLYCSIDRVILAYSIQIMLTSTATARYLVKRTVQAEEHSLKE